MYEENIELIIKCARGRKLFIYGAGERGKRLLNDMSEYNLKISGFIDKRAAEIQTFCDCPVLPPSKLNVNTQYVLLSLSNIEIISILTEAGFKGIDYCFMHEIDLYSKEDFFYKGCKIGRYTYGYKGLLEYQPIANSIGRYCSINDSARIWNNHPNEYITTSPILDSQIFASYPEFLKRRQFCEKYGKYFNNHRYENSPIRNNESVEIGNDVWIGANVIILPGVKISDGAILAAGAVVTKNVDPYYIVGGVPAKTIKKRFNDEEIKKMLKIAWWNWPHEIIEKNIELFYQPEKFIEKFY